MQCAVMAPNPRGSEILMCLGVYLRMCVHKKSAPACHRELRREPRKRARRWRGCGGKDEALWRLCVNRAVVHTAPLTSCEACSQWEMNLQRMSPSDIQERLH